MVKIFFSSLTQNLKKKYKKLCGQNIFFSFQLIQYKTSENNFNFCVTKITKKKKKKESVMINLVLDCVDKGIVEIDGSSYTYMNVSLMTCHFSLFLTCFSIIFSKFYQQIR